MKKKLYVKETAQALRACIYIGAIHFAFSGIFASVTAFFFSFVKLPENDSNINAHRHLSYSEMKNYINRKIKPFRSE